MRMYFIIALALLAGLVVFALLTKMAGRHLSGESVLSWRAVLAALAGLIVLVGGGLLLEQGAGRPDMDYQPPRIEDGVIKPGQFSDPQVK